MFACYLSRYLSQIALSVRIVFASSKQKLEGARGIKNHGETRLREDSAAPLQSLKNRSRSDFNRLTNQSICLKYVPKVCKVCACNLSMQVNVFGR